MIWESLGVMVEECHHAATSTVIEILRSVKAKYVYGATATPMRSDGLKKIGYMLLGNIRYRYTAKDRAKEQGIEHLFVRDLQEAQKDIIISSPQMNRKKVYQMISLLKERQEAGVKVLSKEDMDDNLMRVVSGDIAAEIMEMTFGGEKELMNW